MGLFKRGISLLALGCICTSCTNHRTALNTKDQSLLDQTIKSSVLAFESNDHFSSLDANMQLRLPKNLQQALALYQNQYQDMRIHDFESLQKIGFNILQEAIYQEDVEAQLLCLYGVDLAKHPKLIPILEEALDSPFNLVQMTAIQALAKLPDDRANALLVRGCSSPFLDVALTTVYILAERKHSEVFGLLEALMNKAPPECTEFFPSLLAMIDNPQATQKLRRLMAHPDDRVRAAAIVAAGSSRRTQLLNEIRSLSKQHNLYLQEACAFALGELHDEASISTLQELSRSPSEVTALSALNALRKLGHQSVVSKIEKYAQEGNIYAISLLSETSSDSDLLYALASQKQNKNAAFNAALVLLQKKDPRSLDFILPYLIIEDPTLAVAHTPSPAMTLDAGMIKHKGNSRSQENYYLEQSSLAFRQQILAELSELPEKNFAQIARLIIESDQNDLIPSVIHHLMSSKTSLSKQLLKEWQQKVGSPYVRAWSNLALLKLNEPGPWKEQVLGWVKERKYHRLVRMKDYTQPPKKKMINSFEIQPLETSQLLIESYLALAEKQDNEGIEVLLDSLIQNDLKNRYAIAGLLILSTQ